MSSPPVFDPWTTAWAYADVVATTYAPAGVWRQRQAWRLDRLLRDIAPASALYRERLAETDCTAAPLERLRQMRPVGKRELMQRFGEWVTDPEVTLAGLRAFLADRANRGEPYLGRCIAWESSGTSGEPAVFVQDAQALAVADAVEAARGPLAPAGVAALAGAWRVGTRIALVSATDGHFASVIAFERARLLNPWLRDVSRSFSFMQPIGALVEQLNRFAPTVLATYPSTAWVLSEEQAAGRLRLSLQAVCTGGETLSPAVRRMVHERFRAPVRNSYGASETFVIATECRSGRLHLNADWIVAEPVDEHFRPLPDGEVGATTLLTNLANRLQPIIRYDIGDRVRFVPGTCDCGSSLPVIEVEGRNDDVLTLEAENGRVVHLSPLALVALLEEDVGVFDFQVLRRGTRALQLDLVRPPGPAGSGAARAVELLTRFLSAQGLAGIRIEVRERPGLPARGRSGKQRRILNTAATPQPRRN